MNWGRIILGGLAAGIVMNITDFAMHGGLFAGYYSQYDIFDVGEPANPLYFLLISLCVGLAIAILFAKSRTCWGDGLAGGALFGFLVGLTGFWAPFYHPLVLNGFPYFLSWYWGFASLVDAILAGVVLALIIKRT